MRCLNEPRWVRGTPNRRPWVASRLRISWLRSVDRLDPAQGFEFMWEATRPCARSPRNGRNDLRRGSRQVWSRAPPRGLGSSGHTARYRATSSKASTAQTAAAGPVSPKRPRSWFAGWCGDSRRPGSNRRACAWQGDAPPPVACASQLNRRLVTGGALRQAPAGYRSMDTTWTPRSRRLRGWRWWPGNVSLLARLAAALETQPPPGRCS